MHKVDLNGHALLERIRFDALAPQSERDKNFNQETILNTLGYISFYKNMVNQRLIGVSQVSIDQGLAFKGNRI
ncbi:hypothetical protein V8046_004795 [Vibrio parahaemolyticus]|nr:hypothetical protein [Vibrio parahaemolyticus]EJF4460526.1 hypothetical protein [Vibrio parahaemolyticus]EKL0056895.1 hypothetical protein [Vibrio parahaemolyticus]EMD9686070.1 hypothetical protein [Vibrio parahaemolyticus]